MNKFSIKNLGLDKVFNWKDEYGRGRCCMLTSAWINTTLLYLISDALYSAFLIAKGYSMVEVSALSVVSLLSSFFALASPLILERFKRRKLILGVGRFLFYALNLLGITAIPSIFHDRTAMLIASYVTVFLAGALNTIVTSGYSAWHVNFIQGESRLYYFSCQQTSTTIISTVLIFLMSMIADRLDGTAWALPVMTYGRIFAMVFGILDVVLLSLPNEYEYAKNAKEIRLDYLVKLPFGNKKFIATVGILCLWFFAQGLTSSVYNYYMITEMKASLKLMNLTIIFYSVALIFTSKFWRQVVRKRSWIATFGICGLIHAPSALFYILMTPSNVTWIFILVALTQGFAGVGLNLSCMNMVYVNTPIEDQTYYIGFYNMAVNVAPLIGRVIATLAVAAAGNAAVNVFGLEFNVVRWLYLGQFIAYFAASILFIKNREKLNSPQIRK